MGESSEELEEFASWGQAGDQDKMEAEFGDVLFSMINYARFLNINPKMLWTDHKKNLLNVFIFREQGWRVRKAINGHDLSGDGCFWKKLKL
jgi:XTP/dITP diphosphohydrolase